MKYKVCFTIVFYTAEWLEVRLSKGGIMTERLVSVIIPVYNREHTIRRAIDSVLSQTYDWIEIIVVDDGSTDNTVTIVRQYTDKRVRLICQEHCGANRARNVGIEYSKGTYIAFQDSDDEWLPEKLDIQIGFMEKNGYSVCYCPYFLYESDSVSIVPFDYMDREKYQTGLPNILAYHNVVSTQTLIIKRDVLTLLENVYFDEQMPRWQDYEFVIRIAQAVPLGYMDKPLVKVYRSAVSISENKGALYKAVARLIKKHADFLAMDYFLLEFLKSYDMTADTGGNIIEGLNLIQEALETAGLGRDLNIKDMFVISMAEQSAVQNAIDKKECAFHISCLQNRSFLIYGAGKVGQEVYQRLRVKGLVPKCFIVTKSVMKEYIDDIPIITIDDNKKRDYPVIIAISKEYQAELKSNLIDRGYKLFFVYYGTV